MDKKTMTRVIGILIIAVAMVTMSFVIGNYLGYVDGIAAGTDGLLRMVQQGNCSMVYAPVP